MVDREVFDRRTARLEQLVTDLRRLAKTPRDEFLGDHGLQAQAERWLHLAIECVLDMSTHLIADNGWQTPQTNREVFVVLGKHDVLEASLAAKLADWAGLRNVLVHLYLDIDHAILFDIIQGELDQLEAFAAQVVAFVGP